MRLGQLQALVSGKTLNELEAGESGEWMLHFDNGLVLRFELDEEVVGCVSIRVQQPAAWEKVE